MRSAQLYASQPADMHQAAAALTQDYGVSHLDINFGCPVRKITSRGGGAAIPLKPALFASLVRAAVAGAGGAAVTVKMRMGVSPELVRPCPVLGRHGISLSNAETTRPGCRQWPRQNLRCRNPPGVPIKPRIGQTQIGSYPSSTAAQQCVYTHTRPRWKSQP